MAKMALLTLASICLKASNALMWAI